MVHKLHRFGRSVWIASFTLLAVTLAVNSAHGVDQPLIDTLKSDRVSHTPNFDRLDLVDETGIAVSDIGSDLHYLPTRGSIDLIALQPGVAQRGYGSPNYLRGSAADALAYYIDGISQQDPYTNRSIAIVNNNALQGMRLRANSFGVEHGNAMAGLAMLETATSHSSWHGALETLTDNLDSDRFELNLFSGTVHGPLTRDHRLTVSADVERGTFGDRNPGGPDAWNWYWNWHGRLNWHATSDLTASVGVIGNQQDRHWIPPEFYFDATHAPRAKDEQYAIEGRISHELGERTSYQTTVNWFSVSTEQGDGVHFDDLFGYGRPHGNPAFDQEALFRRWDDMYLDPDSVKAGVYVPLHTETMFETRTVELPDSTSMDRDFIVAGDEAHVWDDYYKRENSYIGGRFDFNSQVHADHELKFGTELQRHTVRMYQHFFPTKIYLGNQGGFDDINAYGYSSLGHPIDDDGVDGTKHPVDLAFYVQDQIHRNDFVLTGGLRLDRFDYDTYMLRDPANPLDPDGYLNPEITPDPKEEQLLEAQRLTKSDLTESNTYTRLSPRVSAGFQAGPNTLLHTSYGRYIQRPPIENLYTDFSFIEYKTRTGGYIVPFGNPNLEPLQTKSLEIGIDQRMAHNAKVSATVFTKDIDNYVRLVRQAAAPTSYAIFQTGGSATAKGLEAQFEWRANEWLTTSVNYTLQKVNGTSPPNINSNIAWTSDDPPPNGSSVLNYDQPQRLIALADLRFARNSGPKRGQWYPLSRAGLSIVFVAASGFPYTPLRTYDEVTLGSVSPVPAGKVNSERTPAYYRLDLKANKEVDFGGVTLDVYLWILNVLDRDNVLFVFDGSGSADETGWLDTSAGQEFINANADIDDASVLNGEQKYRLRESLEPNYDIGRQIRFGARFLF